MTSPNDSTVLNKLGATFAEIGMNADALSAYKQAANIRPHYSRVWANMGKSYSILNDNEKALKCFATAIAHNNNAAHLWNSVYSSASSIGNQMAIDAANNRDIGALTKSIGGKIE